MPANPSIGTWSKSFLGRGREQRMLGHAQRVYGALVSLLKYCGKLQRKTNTKFNKKTDPRHQLVFIRWKYSLTLQKVSSTERAAVLDKWVVLCNRVWARNTFWNFTINSEVHLKWPIIDSAITTMDWLNLLLDSKFASALTRVWSY